MLARFRPILIVLVLSGCGSTPVATEERPAYPRHIRQAEVLDIHVLRDETRITATNTSGMNLGPALVWLNGRYSLPIRAWAPGETLTFRLADFADEYGERFRAGGFFSTEAPEPLVLAQVQPEGEERLIGLLVIGQRPE